MSSTATTRARTRVRWRRRCAQREHRGRVGVGHDVGEPVGGEAGVQRHVRRARLEHGQHGHVGVHRVVEQQRHPVPRADPPGRAGAGRAGWPGRPAPGRSASRSPVSTHGCVGHAAPAHRCSNRCSSRSPGRQRRSWPRSSSIRTRSAGRLGAVRPAGVQGRTHRVVSSLGSGEPRAPAPGRGAGKPRSRRGVGGAGAAVRSAGVRPGRCAGSGHGGRATGRCR